MFFGRTGVSPTRFVYEDIMSDPQASVRAVANIFDLGSSARMDLTKVSVRIQRVEPDSEWRARFIAEVGDRSYTDPV